MKLSEARILLTGASGGIGQEAARACLAAGASLMLAGRSQSRLAQQAAMLAAGQGVTHSRVAYCVADLDELQAVDGLARHAGGWGCNVVVHAAGAPSFGPLEAHGPESMLRVLRTNLLAPMALTRALLPHLRRQARAQVLFVGSVLGRIGLPGYSVYSASKFGLRGFAEALRRELASTGVGIQYLGPRSTRTGFNNADVEAYNRDTGTATDSAERVAAAMLEMIEDGSAERFLGFPETLGVRINGLAPTLLDASFRRHSRSVADLQPSTERLAP